MGGGRFALTFLENDALIEGRRREYLSTSVGPAYFDAVSAGRAGNSKVRTRVVAREVTESGVGHPYVPLATTNDGHDCPGGVALVRGVVGTDQKPASCLLRIVAVVFPSMMMRTLGAGLHAASLEASSPKALRTETLRPHPSRQENGCFTLGGNELVNVGLHALAPLENAADCSLVEPLAEGRL